MGKTLEYFDELASTRSEAIYTSPILFHELVTRQDQIVRLIPKDAEIILDAGCGSGLDRFALTLLSSRYVGTDFSLEMLHAVPGRNRGLVLSDLTKLPFKDESFNFVLCSEVLEHIPSWKKAVSELSRVLKPKGTLIVSTPNKLSVHYPQKLYLNWRYKILRPYDKWKTFWGLKKGITQAGLTVTQVRGACYLPGPFFDRLERVMEPFLPLLRKLEPVLARLPTKYFGYIIIVKAVKE